LNSNLATEIAPRWRNLISDKTVESGEWIEIRDPADGSVFAEAAAASPADVDAAVAAAERVVASRALSAMRPLDRGRLVQRMGALLRARAEETAELLCRDVGKSISEARGEAIAAARYFEYFGGLAAGIEGRFIPQGDTLATFVRPEPYGVVGHIIPWNFPHLMAARSIAPALSAGNANVIKSPELAPLACYIFAEVAREAGFPPGAVNVLAGTGQIAGAALAAHPGVRLLVFTGSVATGRAIMTAAARNIVPTVLELGGKSAAIVRADADIDNVIANIRVGIFENAGQVCDAMSRLIVETPVYEDVVEAIRESVKSLTIGPGRGDPDITPLISAGQRDRVARYSEISLREGARLVTGGAAPAGMAGYFFEPTVFADVNSEMTAHREEVFGPFLTVSRADDLQDAERLANATDYGLSSGVFTRDIDAALWCAERLDAGLVHVNEWALGSCEVPFGGTKHSGIGRERGLEGLEGYLQSKAVGFRRRSSFGVSAAG
jgi:acyl-CoA reductase-like NAD-dependent aldehyde dehydrogenase